MAVIFSACSIKEPSLDYRQDKIEKLTSLLESLSSSVDKEEAQDLALNSISFSYKLQKKYEVISPPLWQNTLVNIGLKKRGLCYHWADDLWLYLQRKKYQTFKIYYITANRGFLTEHNAISVGAVTTPFQKSIVLDAWRNSGDLYFIGLEKDNEYEWKERKLLASPPKKGGKVSL